MWSATADTLTISSSDADSHTASFPDTTADSISSSSATGHAVSFPDATADISRIDAAAAAISCAIAIVAIPLFRRRQLSGAAVTSREPTSVRPILVL
jgi:hypothetical protein